MKKVFLFLIIILISSPIFALENLKLKIGTYENAPKLFTDENGNISGFWADITNYIAKKEGWKIEWVHGDWDQCMQRLENNDIDIMLDVGITPERQKKFLFSNETVLLSWSKLYIKKGINFESIMDLDGKKIAGLKGSFNINGPEGLKDIISKFGLNSEIIELSDYHKVFEAIQDGSIFAGITNKDFGTKNETKYNIQKTPIIFQPARLQFAFPKNSELSPNLIKIIDNNILQLKNDQKSIYFNSMGKYLGGVNEIRVLPHWVIILIISAFSLIIIFFIFNLFLKHQVKQKTMLLRQDIEKREQVEKELILSQSLLQAELESSADGILSVGRDGAWFNYNQNFLNIWGIPVSIHETMNDKIAFEYISEKLIAPEEFHTKVKELYKNPEMESFDIIEMKDGQILEHYTKPQWLKKEIVGRVWSFRNITSRIQAENEVKRELSEKENILKEVHHRIKNNFASIASLLSIQTDTLTNPEAITALKDAIGRVYSMQILYEKLLLTDDYKETSIRNYLSNLIDDIINLFSKNMDITNEKQIDDFQIDSKILFPIGLIINELITNIMKYAFTGRDSGHIKVTLKKNQENVTLIIQDNGNGLPEGFNSSESEGLGLMLINMLSQQINGNFTIENSNGTKNTLKFSI